MKTHFTIYVLLTIALFSCNLISQKQIPSNEELESRIKEMVTSGADELVISNLTEFEWDSLIILAPYTLIEDCPERFNIDCGSIEHSGIQHLDDRCVLVFLNEGQICTMVESKRHPGDFVPSVSRYFTPEEAIFRIVETDDQLESGEKWIELKVKESTTPNTR